MKVRGFFVIQLIFILFIIPGCSGNEKGIKEDPVKAISFLPDSFLKVVFADIKSFVNSPSYSPAETEDFPGIKELRECLSPFGIDYNKDISKMLAGVFPVNPGLYSFSGIIWGKFSLSGIDESIRKTGKPSAADNNLNIYYDLRTKSYFCLAGRESALFSSHKEHIEIILTKWKNKSVRNGIKSNLPVELIGGNISFNSWGWMPGTSGNKDFLSSFPIVKQMPVLENMISSLNYIFSSVNLTGTEKEKIDGKISLHMASAESAAKSEGVLNLLQAFGKMKTVDMPPLNNFLNSIETGKTGTILTIKFKTDFSTVPEIIRAAYEIIF